MNIILKSKFIRSELKHWLLIVVLLLWAMTASVFASLNREKLVLIGVDDSGTRLIANQSDRLLKQELSHFVKQFLDLYYSYDEKTFLARAGNAADLFSEELWTAEKGKLLELNQKLQKTPLTQSFKIKSIDLVEPGKIEALLTIVVKTRLQEQTVGLKVLLSYKASERTDTNAFPYTITELSDVAL